MSSHEHPEPEPLPDADPADVQPTDNSAGTPVDLDRVEEIEGELKEDS